MFINSVRCFSPKHVSCSKPRFSLKSQLYSTSSIKDVNTRCTQDLLISRVKSALENAFGKEIASESEAMLLPAKPEHGDYQCNAALPLAKRLKLKPRDVADKLMASLEVGDVVDSMDISGPGFINLKLSEKFVKGKIVNMLKDPTRLGVAAAVTPSRIIVDFSSPNIAKEMHVVSWKMFISGGGVWWCLVI